jgi:sterol 3beta-glucosyltransferase
MSLENRWSMKNKMSFHIVDEFMWMGLGSMINDFRTDVLKLEPFRIGDGGESVLENNEVPISHMWSSSFVPRCADWPLHVDVVGDFTRSKSKEEEEEAVEKPFQADPRLLAFLAASESPPIFIGFGSMVISDPTALVEMVKVRRLAPALSLLFCSVLCCSVLCCPVLFCSVLSVCITLTDHIYLC